MDGWVVGRRDFLRLSGAAGLIALAGGVPKAAAATVDEPSATPARTDFNALHAPPGAYASFTLGHGGSHGGLAIAGLTDPGQDVLVGATRADGSTFALPFFTPVRGDAGLHSVTPTRDHRLATDTWTAEDLTFRLISSTGPVPEPGTVSDAELRDALVPAVLAELTLDNRRGTTARQAFLGLRVPNSYGALADVAARPGFNQLKGGNVEPALRLSARGGGGGAPAALLLDGNTPGRRCGLFCADDGVTAAAGTSVGLLTGGGPGGGKGSAGALRLPVPAGQRRTFRVAVAFHQAGTVASGGGLAARYWYAGLFADIDAVAAHVLGRARVLRGRWAAGDALADEADLSADQRFHLVHAIRTYQGSTALLQRADGRPLWAVMEGEYGNINTLDLAVDHLFHELRTQPWTVRNVLDTYLERYGYTDHVGRVASAGDPVPLGNDRYLGATRRDPESLPGGVSFAHDMGVFPAFSPQGRSAYEQPNQQGVGAFMTGEQLTNWTLMALVYVAQTGDARWAAANEDALTRCLASMVARDAAPGGERDGVQSLESDKSGLVGAEITTYDALDRSLGQARHSAALASRQWAAYVCLQRFFAARGGRVEEAALAGAQAARVAAALVRSADAAGRIPAVLAADGEPAVPAQVIPVIEGLVFPLFGGAPDAVRRDGPHGALVGALDRHLRAVLRPGACVLPNGAWAISSTSPITWLSKVYLCQFIARRVLGLPWDEAARRADAAGMAWLTDPKQSHWAWSDQIKDGAIYFSRYYPRGVLASLWLEEDRASARLSPAPVDGRCVTARTVTLHLRTLRGHRLASAEVWVDGRRVARVRSGRMTVRVRLFGLSRRVSEVRIVGRTARGGTVRMTRRYRRC